MSERYTILLTGAAGGIGSTIARYFAADGHRLLLTDINAGPLEKLASELCFDLHTEVETLTRHFAADGGKQPGKPATQSCSDLHTDVQTFAADLTSVDDRNQLVREARRFNVDVLINAAGFNRFGLLEDISDTDIERIFSVNIISPILLCKSLLPWLATRKSAHIVNIGSTFGSLGYAGFASYSATKFSLRGFSEALRREIADTSIKVHYLAPRAVKTAFNEDAVNRMNEALGVTMDSPDVIPGAIAQMIRRGQSEHFIGGPEKLFVKLNTLFHRLVDKGLAGQLKTIQHHARIATGNGEPDNG
jgi:short-subunit dehydrogenase